MMKKYNRLNMFFSATVYSISFMLILIFLQGCAASFMGHKIPLDKMKSLEKGTTTKNEIKQILGEPEDITFNSIKGTTVFGYRWVSSKALILGIPTINISRKYTDGFKLNIIFVGETYQGYTLTKLKETLF